VVYCIEEPFVSDWEELDHFDPRLWKLFYQELCIKGIVKAVSNTGESNGYAANWD
jgi:hypothetical protein